MPNRSKALRIATAREAYINFGNALRLPLKRISDGFLDYQRNKDIAPETRKATQPLHDLCVEVFDSFINMKTALDEKDALSPHSPDFTDLDMQIIAFVARYNAMKTYFVKEVESPYALSVLLNKEFKEINACLQTFGVDLPQLRQVHHAR